MLLSLYHWFNCSSRNYDANEYDEDEDEVNANDRYGFHK